MGHCWVVLGILNHGGAPKLGSANVCSAAIFETFLYHKDIWIAATDYFMYFYLIVLFPLTAMLQFIFVVY